SARPAARAMTATTPATATQGCASRPALASRPRRRHEGPERTHGAVGDGGGAEERLELGHRVAAAQRDQAVVARGRVEAAEAEEGAGRGHGADAAAQVEGEEVDRRDAIELGERARRVAGREVMQHEGRDRDVDVAVAEAVEAARVAGLEAHVPPLL